MGKNGRRAYTNKYRVERTSIVTEENKDQLITEEFAREVIGEGQLFFYYKRHAMEEFASGTDVTNTYKMLLSNYVVPLPKSETDNRQ